MVSLLFGHIFIDDVWDRNGRFDVESTPLFGCGEERDVGVQSISVKLPWQSSSSVIMRERDGLILIGRGFRRIASFIPFMDLRST